MYSFVIYLSISRKFFFFHYKINCAHGRMRKERWKRSITSVPELKNSLIPFFLINILVNLYKPLYCMILYKYNITLFVYLDSYLNFISQHWNINISCVVSKPLNSVLNNYMIAQQMCIAQFT